MEMDKQTINQTATAPRVIAMTDFPPINVIPGSTFKEGEPREMYSDPDDVQSLIRLLLYANELEIEGLVASAGSLANIARKRNILDVLDVYEQVQPNLAEHDPRYPIDRFLCLFLLPHRCSCSSFSLRLRQISDISGVLSVRASFSCS